MSIRKVILVVLATLVIFAAGVITGGVLVKKTTPEPLRNPQPQNFFPGRFDQVRRALNEMELPPGQRSKVEHVIRLSQEEIADYFLILAPDIQSVFARMRDNIHAELAPEQRRRFDELMKKRLQRSPMAPNSNRPDFSPRNNGGQQGRPLRDRPEGFQPDGAPRPAPSQP